MDGETQLSELCERLETTPILEQEEARAMNRRAFAKAFKTWQPGQTYGEAMGGLTILDQDEEAFRSELKLIDNGAMKRSPSARISSMQQVSPEPTGHPRPIAHMCYVRMTLTDWSSLPCVLVY